MRIAVHKTLKLYIGGAFVRSESGRTVKVTGPGGEVMHVSQGSRKDLREAVGKARGAQPGWAGRTAYNRGQILYRLAEMLESRADSLPTSEADRRAAVDRAVYHAGWTDKIGALLSTLNPVSGTYVNYSMTVPMGVVAAFPRAEDGLLGMVEALAAPLVMGDTVVVVVPAASAPLALALAESLATSDLPAGVVNLITGQVDELLGWANKHDDIDAITLVDGVVDEAAATEVEVTAARMIRRVLRLPPATQAAGPDTLQRLCEIRTVWMSS